MSLEENKAIVRRFLEVWNNRNLEVIDEVVGSEGSFHMNRTALFKGPGEYKAVSEILFAAFPDLSLSIEELAAEGDSVFCRFGVRGTHQGRYEYPPVGSIAPSGKIVKSELLGVYRIEDGKIVEGRIVQDFLGFLQQMGALPVPAVPAK